LEIKSSFARHPNSSCDKSLWELEIVNLTHV
jgi:hypothetical protein